MTILLNVAGFQITIAGHKRPGVVRQFLTLRVRVSTRAVLFFFVDEIAIRDAYCC